MVNHSNAARKSGYIFEYRLTFLGDKKTGKTSVLNRFMSDTFTHRYRPTIEDHITHVIDHNGNMCVCLMVDTCGGNDFPAMKRLAISKGNAFLVVYATNDRRTFEEAKRTAEEIKKSKPSSEDVKIIIIGNKIDLVNEREVQSFEGENLAKHFNQENVTSQFFEVSAKCNQNIHLIFINLLNMFIPEEIVPESIPEKSTFSRMSLRKKSKKNRLRKQTAIESLSQQNTHFYSDSDLTEANNYLDVNAGMLLRSSSLANNRSDCDSSDSGVDTSPQESPKMERSDIRRQSSAKDIFKKTFGSMQKIFRTDSEFKRSNSMDNHMKRSPTVDSL